MGGAAPQSLGPCWLKENTTTLFTIPVHDMWLAKNTARQHLARVTSSFGDINLSSGVSIIPKSKIAVTGSKQNLDIWDFQADRRYIYGPGGTWIWDCQIVDHEGSGTSG